MAWQLTRASNGAPLLCAESPASTASSRRRPRRSAASQAIDDQFECADHSGVTSVLPEGTYTVHRRRAQPRERGDRPADTLTNKTIVRPNEVTDLHTITIPIDSL